MGETPMCVEFQVLKDNCKASPKPLNPTEVGKVTRMLAKYIQKANDLGLHICMKPEENFTTLVLSSPDFDNSMKSISLIKNLNEFPNAEAV